MTALSVRDVQRLVGVNRDLVRVVNRAADLCPIKFMVVEGVRTLAKQREYFAAGKSKTMKSRHLDGHAVDLAPIVDTDGDGDLELSWAKKDFAPIVKAMKQAAKELNIPMEHGSDWGWDEPHHQLTWAAYP